jgi:hypothetical protein
MKIVSFAALAAALVFSGSAASAAKYGNALNGKACILHVPAGKTAKGFYMLLPRVSAEAHLRQHAHDRRLGASACRLRKPGANK